MVRSRGTLILAAAVALVAGPLVALPSQAAPPPSVAAGWGAGSAGQIGNGRTESAPAPVGVLASGALAGRTLTAISDGGGHVCVLDTDGRAFCWGRGDYGQLGTGTAGELVPAPVVASGALAGKTLVAIAAGSDHTCAVDSAGAAYCWGAGSSGRLGNGGVADSPLPVAVDTSGVLAGKVLVAIGAGGAQTCAVDNAGAAYCWGAGSSGRLGNGTTVSSAVPVAVTASGVLAGKQLVRITAGGGHACALDTAGQAYCWGDGSKGQLGTGSSNDSLMPATVNQAAMVGRPVVSLSAGSDHTCAVDSAGAAYCWGQNGSGRLGTGDYHRASKPTAVASGVLTGRTLTSVAAASRHTCVLDSAGLAYCWGANDTGQLGTGKLAGSTVPVAVLSSGALAGRAILAIAAGGSSSAALVAGGTLPSAPLAPTGLVAAPGSRRVTLSWSPADPQGSPVTKYVVSAQPGTRTCKTAGELTCTVTGLQNGDPYTFSVAAENAVGSSAPSAVVVATPTAGSTPTPPPRGPAPLLIWVQEKVKGKKVVLKWGASNATSYRVRLSKPGSKSKFRKWVTTSRTTVKFKVKRHRNYRFQIIATGPGGSSPAQTWVFRS